MDNDDHIHADRADDQRISPRRASDRLSMSPSTLAFSEQLDIGLIRIDCDEPQLNSIAQKWIGDGKKQFLSAPIIVTAANTTDLGAKCDYTLPSGRTVRVRRLCSGERVWLALSDITLETDHNAVMADVANVGTGLLYYIPSTGQHRVFGAFLDQKLSSSEQLEIRKNGLIPLLRPRDKRRVITMVKNTLDNGVPFRTNMECQTRRGECFTIDLSLRAVLATDGSVSKMIGVFRDVTPERRAESELLRLRDKAASNLEAQNHMLARVGHEIRTPMSGVIGMADALMNTPGTEGFRSQLSIIQNATRDALSMLDETMDFSKLGTDQFRLREDALDVAKLVGEAAQLWTQRAAEMGTQLRLRRDPNLPDAVLLDSRRLRQCLTNILSNAVKFTRNGTVDLIVGVRPDDSTDPGSDPAAQRLVVAVRDTGSGMSEGELKSLFTPYAQGAAGTRTGGTGLGMTITREILTRMGGTIRCASVKDEGTTFVVSLPLKTPVGGSRDLVSNLLATNAPETDCMPLRVLAVDDNKTNRLVVENMLDGRVTSVDTARDGYDALQALEDKEFDVILMDIHMPHMDGIEATLAIRNSGKPYANTPIIALTADTEYQQRRVAINLGMDDALAKPVTLSNLLNAFERLSLGDSNPRALSA